MRIILNFGKSAAAVTATEAIAASAFRVESRINVSSLTLGVMPTFSAILVTYQLVYSHQVVMITLDSQVPESLGI